jgi:hypothetical protein
MRAARCCKLRKQSEQAEKPDAQLFADLPASDSAWCTPVRDSLFDIFVIGGGTTAGLASGFFGLFLLLLGAGTGAAVTYVCFVFKVGRLELKMARLERELRSARENGAGKNP